ncbi:MAG: aminomethyltransferase beta-barrel domain-containing protein, partial [Candidatus Omnitrophota bacterium]
RINANIRPGLIVDANGKVLGEHKGVAFYTIGQRQGLGIACGYPAFIINIDPKGNKITLGSRPEACKKEFLVKDSSFIQARIKKEVALKVKIRYNHQEARAIVVPQKNRFRVIFQEPQFAITPGQSAVFYDDDAVIGGGIIYEVIA